MMIEHVTYCPYLEWGDFDVLFSTIVQLWLLYYYYFFVVLLIGLFAICKSFKYEDFWKCL